MKTRAYLLTVTDSSLQLGVNTLMLAYCYFFCSEALAKELMAQYLQKTSKFIIGLTLHWVPCPDLGLLQDHHRMKYFISDKGVDTVPSSLHSEKAPSHDPAKAMS